MSDAALDRHLGLKELTPQQYEFVRVLTGRFDDLIEWVDCWRKRSRITEAQAVEALRERGFADLANHYIYYLDDQVEVENRDGSLNNDTEEDT